MKLRADSMKRLTGQSFDVLIVGGGINGAVSAAALAGRGVSVAMIDRGDFASFTSQESSNLVWGGFKYLENYEIPLVVNLSRSRNRLMRAYPSAITELRFWATLDSSSPVSSWLAALGTVGYWGLGQFATKPPKYHRPKAITAEEPIVRVDTAEAAVEYGDAYLKDNDARFVWGFVRSAIDHGAVAANYVELTEAERVGEVWRATMQDTVDGHSFDVEAKVLINAAGPFVDQLNDRWDIETKHRIVYSKGIHLVVPQLTTSERVLAFFDDSQRLFYVIPMAHRSVIGTTDTRTTATGEGASDDDRHFLLKQINDRLSLPSPLTTDDIIAERSGVRPLVVLNDGDDRTDIDWTTLSRKHEIEVDKEAALVTIFGGKLTDCLNVGEEITDAIANFGIDLAHEADDWYGEPSDDERRRFIDTAASLGVGLDRRPEIEREDSLSAVLWRRHGLAAHDILEVLAEDESLAEPIMAETDLLRAELPLYAEREMITTMDDFCRRRTKLAMLHRPETLAAAPGLAEAAAILGVT
ncbi:MAG: FAD-dependent oxidoreductase [Actinomycetia bacterium]|nr:FAD-dependent oxidoreductase [Actinomycetes bacterium]